MTLSLYGTSPLKRSRRTRTELEAIDTALLEWGIENRPFTVRQAFYAMSVRYVVGKDETGYDVVQRQLLALRRAGIMPFGWITDNTRMMRKPRTHSSLEAALYYTQQTYRHSVWADSPVYVEIWLEKDALSGVLYGETYKYDVPLMVARGFSSETFIHSAAQTIADEGKPAYLYYFGDHDPSGVEIDRKIEAGIRKYVPKAEVHFQRVAVHEWQIDAWNLPTRPTKQSDSRAKNFKGDSVELDAIPPLELRRLARECITQHLDPRYLSRIAQQEAHEKEQLLDILAQLEGN